MTPCQTCVTSALLTAGLIPHREEFTDCHGVRFQVVDGKVAA